MEIEFSDDDGPDVATEGPTSHDLEKIAFLVIDDSGVQRKFITNALVDFGAQNIKETKDAVDGLSVLRDSKNHVDVVLVDQEMPILDGIQFTRMVRQDASLPNPDIPIIMVTSLSSPAHITEAKKAGVDGFVAKPFTPDAMQSYILSVLERRALPKKSSTPKLDIEDRDLKGIRCLVIDDSEFSRKLVCRSLYSLGIKNVLQAVDAVDGLSIMREKFQTIDLILVDREMPIFDGVEFTRMVRHDEALGETRIPIIMVSGLVGQRNVLDAKTAGVNAFVAKPFSTKEIEAQIRIVLNDPHKFVVAKGNGVA